MTSRGYDGASVPVGNPLEPAPPGTAEYCRPNRTGHSVSGGQLQDDDQVRPRTRESGSAWELHPRGVHGRSDLDRHAEALATLAASYRRVFIR